MKQDFIEDMQHRLNAGRMKLHNPEVLTKINHSTIPEWQPDTDGADVTEGLRAGATQYILNLIRDKEITLGELQEEFLNGFVKRHDIGRTSWWMSRNNSNEVRYKHGVRGILQQLVDQGLIKRPRRGVYVIAKE